MREKNEKLVEYCQRGDITSVAEALKAGADVHTIDDYPLQLAASNGDLPLVKFLLGCGAYVHADNNLALRLAVEHVHTKVAAVLRKAMEKRGKK